MAFPPRKPRDPVQDKSGWVRLGGLGFELVAAVLGFALAGLWIDRRYGTEPWGVVVGAVLGITGGLYNLVKDELRGAARARRQDEEKKQASAQADAMSVPSAQADAETGAKD